MESPLTVKLVVEDCEGGVVLELVIQIVRLAGADPEVGETSADIQRATSSGSKMLHSCLALTLR